MSKEWQALYEYAQKHDEVTLHGGTLCSLINQLDQARLQVDEAYSRGREDGECGGHVR